LNPASFELEKPAMRQFNLREAKAQLSKLAIFAVRAK
jgi:hypothetical protein